MGESLAEARAWIAEIDAGSREGRHYDVVRATVGGRHFGRNDVPVRARIVSYDQPVGCAAAYYPETNPLIPLDSKAEGSNTPTSKSVVVRLEPAREGAHTGITKAARDDAETGHKRPIDTSPPS